MCMVSVLLEAQRNWESMLNTRELMFTYLEPNKDRTGHSTAITQGELLGLAHRGVDGQEGDPSMVRITLHSCC